MTRTSTSSVNDGGRSWAETSTGKSESRIAVSAAVGFIFFIPRNRKRERPSRDSSEMNEGLRRRDGNPRRRRKRQELEETVDFQSGSPRVARGNRRRQQRPESAVRQRRAREAEARCRGAGVGTVVGQDRLEVERQAPSLGAEPTDERSVHFDERRAKTPR